MILNNKLYFSRTTVATTQRWAKIYHMKIQGISIAALLLSYTMPYKRNATTYATSYAATFQVLPPSSLPSASCLIFTQSMVSDPTFVFSELESADGRLSAKVNL